MAMKYLDMMFTDSVRRAQKQYYGVAGQVPKIPTCDPLGPEEAAFIEARDSFYLGTVSQDGWPYIQHRGGPAGFLRVLDPSRLAFADYKGNRQLLSTGHVFASGRVALFLMDYRNRTRLKILAHARIEDARAHPELIPRLADPKICSSVERFWFIDVVSFDWNCPKYIAPRYSMEEIEELTSPLRERIAELETQLRTAKTRKILLGGP